MIKELRPYQTEAFEDITSIFDNNRYRGIMYQLVTGGGKTVIAAKIIRYYLERSKRVWFMCDREELIDQAHDTLQNFQIWAGTIKADLPLQEQFGCQVCSIQTVINRRNLKKPDIIIIDEAHGVQPENSYGQIIERYPEALVLGITATPVRVSGHGFCPPFDVLLKGPTYPEMVKNRWLIDLDYFSCEAPKALEDVPLNDQGEYDEAALYDAMKMAPLVDNYLEYAKGKSLLAFGVNIQHSKDICKKFNEAGIQMVHVDGDTPKFDRKRIVSRFKKGQIKAVSNCDLFTKGFDYQGLECVMLARKTASLPLFLQMIGRGTRVFPSKEKGIILDNANNYIEHGLPWRDFNWDAYFVGYKDRKKTKIEEMITVVEIEFMDEKGQIRKTNNPQEVVGMKLVNIKEHVIPKEVNLTSLKEFDKQFALFMSPKFIKMRQPGYNALKNYIDYCKRNHYSIDAPAWQYIYRKLNEEPKENIAAIKSGIFELESGTRTTGELFVQTKIDEENRKLDYWKRKLTPTKLIKQLESKYKLAHQSQKVKKVDF